MADASRPGADELVDLTYFIACQHSAELHNSSCVAISGFHQHADAKMASKVTSSRHTLEKSFANVADIGGVWRRTPFQEGRQMG
jgi:hypothetical protein